MNNPELFSNVKAKKYFTKTIKVAIVLRKFNQHLIKADRVKPV